MTNLYNLNFLLQLLLKNYLFDSRCVFVFTDSINEIEWQPEIPTIYLKVANDTLNPYLIFQRHGCQDIVVHHANACNLFVRFEKLIQENSERFNTRRYIIIGENALEVFQTQEQEHVSDILVLVPKNVGNSDESYDLVTHFYDYKSRSNLPVILDTWFPNNCSFLYGSNLFPDKLYNQNGRELRIGTVIYKPNSIVDNETFDGTETSLVLEFVKKYNLTPNFNVMESWGDIYENGTGMGLLGSIPDDIVDIAYSSLITWEEYYSFVDYSRSLIRTGIRCLVPAPQFAAGWFMPLFSFSSGIWANLSIVLICDSMIFSLLLSRNDKYSTVRRSARIKNEEYLSASLITTIKLYLLQPMKLPRKGKLIKYFLGLNMITVLLLTSAYSSGLSSVMTVPRYEEGVQTVKDLAHSGLHWGATTDAWIFAMRQVEEPEYKTVRDNFVVRDEEELKDVSKSNNFAFAVEWLPFGHYAVGSYIESDVIPNYRIMQEDIYWSLIIFMLRKNSVLLPLLDNLILRVFEAGLEAYWENKAVSQHMDMRVQRAIHYHVQHKIHGRETIKLRWTHVQGAFAVLLIGYCISTLIFIREMNK